MESGSNLRAGYAEAYRMACEAIGRKEPAEIAAHAGCILVRGNTLRVRFLAEQYLVDCKSGEVRREDNADTDVAQKALVLHYLLHAKEAERTETLISFREVRGGGQQYYPVFQKRAEAPLLKAFDGRTHLLVPCGLRLGGRIAGFGSAGVTLPVFPNVPVTYILWTREEEQPPSCAILFESSVHAFLPCEDVVLSASMGAHALIRELRRQTGEKPLL